MRIAITALSMILVVSGLYSDGAASSGRMSAHLDSGISKVSGDLYEDTSYRLKSGLALLYSASSHLRIGLYGGYTKWTPDKVESLLGSNRIVEGSIQNLEFIALARIVSHSENIEGFSLFGEFGFGYCFLDSGAEVFSRPVIPDPGPYTFLYKIDSQNKPCIRAGLGIEYRFTDRFGIEAVARFNNIFTEEKRTKYYSVSGGLVFLLF